MSGGTASRFWKSCRGPTGITPGEGFTTGRGGSGGNGRGPSFAGGVNCGGGLAGAGCGGSGAGGREGGAAPSSRGRPDCSARRRRSTGSSARRATVFTPVDPLRRSSCARLVTPSFSRRICSCGSSPSLSSGVERVAASETVFSSIIGFVMVVKSIASVLAPASLGPAARSRTCPWASMSTKTFSSRCSSRSAYVSGRFSALMRSALCTRSSWVVIEVMKSSSRNPALGDVVRSAKSTLLQDEARPHALHRRQEACLPARVRRLRQEFQPSGDHRGAHLERHLDRELRHVEPHARRHVHVAEERDQRVGERGVHRALASGAQGSGAARPCAGAVLAGGAAAGAGVAAGVAAAGCVPGAAGCAPGAVGVPGAGGVGTLALLLMSWIAAESAKRSSGKVSLANRTVTWPVRSARMLMALCALRLVVFTITLVAPNGLRPAVPLMLPLVTL